MGRRDKKRPSVREEPSASAKAPRVAVSGTSFYDHSPSWRFAKLDIGGPWCVSKLSGALVFDSTASDGAGQVLSRLRKFESMTWREIIGKQNHPIPIEHLSADAQRRLQTLEIDDVDELISLRVTGARRVFGIRIESVLAILWWDPEHEVCPSTYKD